MLGDSVFTLHLGDVTVSKTAYAPHMVMPAHAHDLPYVSFVVDGRYTEHRAGLPCQLHRDMLVFHPAGEVHADCVHDVSMATINVEFHRADAPGEFLYAKGATVDALAEALLSALSGPRRSLRESIAALDEFLASRFRALQPSDRMRSIRDQLRNGDSPRPVTSMAEKLGIHRGHLHRDFRQAYGVSPREDVINQRLTAAASLLTASGASIAAIAAECGFYDQSQFCRRFKALTGLPPSAYRTAFAG